MPAGGPASSAKRDAIVRAATTLFSRYGFRKTSVDLIAHTAEVAKPTLYAHFADKDAIFVAVCGHVVDDILADAARARTLPGVVDRLTAMLAAKFTRIWELVDASPHAHELLAASDGAAREVVARADAAYLKLLGDALDAAARAGELAPVRRAQLAPLLLRAGHGAAYGATSPAHHRAQLRELVDALLPRPTKPASRRSPRRASDRPRPT
jgi:AcrR family transcriptional regulator